MAVTINGSTGISGVDGSAGTPALIGSDADTGIFLAAGQVSASVNGTAGNVPLVSGTAQASTSGTSIDFTGIPSWVKRITVMFSGVSLSGTAHQLIQLGAGSITTSGYTAGSNYLTGGVNSGATTSTAGMPVFAGSTANINTGHIIFTLISGSTWVCSGLCLLENTSFIYTGGKVTLSGTLDRLRVTSTNGTDTFDAGSINIMYE